ncbi:MAG: efflux RND transporter permease subunit [Gammaproteobacteria bacterium]|nr:efflux RND transporter permease subunit [Gammaproteobacteria bacterium]
MLQRFLENHVLANVTFVVVLLVGTLSFMQLPRAQDPEINFNWISVITTLPGASAEDVEKLVTNPLEDAIAQVDDVKFVSSFTRQGISNISARFEDISAEKFDKRMNDLRREVQSKANAELPQAANDPMVLEITSANSFPTAMLVVRGHADDEVLRQTALAVKEDLERIKGVDGVTPAGLHGPELRIEYDPQKLQAYGVSPSQLADTVSAYFRDVSAGKVQLGSQDWLVRMVGTDAAPGYLESLNIMTARGEVPIRHVADVTRARKQAEQLVYNHGQPSVLLAVTKKPYNNTLQLMERVNQYIASQNQVLGKLGIEILLLDDQTYSTRNAISVMQNNAIVGLLLVALVTWVFLGTRIAFFVGIGIPFTLAGTFWLLSVSGQTLNQSVLLGVVIVLGMLVDDAVVVVEAIYYRLQRGTRAMQAAIESLAEVFKPVTASVLTTIAAFLPLMLLPGIVGDFMFVIPFVVTVALLVSLLEAYWMLPVHIAAANVNFDNKSRMQQRREYFTHRVRLNYSRGLIWVFRNPRKFAVIFVLVVLGAVAMLAAGWVKTKFFAFDPLRVFYVNVEMPSGTPLSETLRVVAEVESKARAHLHQGELRESVAVAGQMFTETAPFFGDQFGQVTISLQPDQPGMRSVEQMVEAMRADVINTVGAARISFLILSGGPPASKPINVKVRGDDYTQLRSATAALRKVLESMPAVRDISDDDSEGSPELVLRLDTNAIKRAGLHAADVARNVRLMFDGEVVTSMQDRGEKLEVRVQGSEAQLDSVDDLLRQTLPLSGGGYVSLGQLVEAKTSLSKEVIRHHDFRRAITLQADLDKEQMDTPEANAQLFAAWETIRLNYPGVNLDTTGELDDIQESLDAMLMLFLFGIGLIYLILGTQFRSYWQPFMILATVPLAFIGVVYGLALSGNPLSLFTLYGVVALTGIAVNTAIVMIDAANARMTAGMSSLHAIVYAARRRVVPILITSLTTVAGLMSLALGLGGESLVWGPVASAIVWGLTFSTILTLFVIPLLYRFFMTPRHKSRGFFRKKAAA